MPGESNRKLIPMGEGALVVSLPADYRRYHKLAPGVGVRVLYDSLLLIIPPGAEHKAEERAEDIKRLLE